MSSSSSSSSREWTPEEEGKGGGEEGNAVAQDAQKRGGRRLVWLPVTALVATGVCYAIMYGFFFRSDKDPEEEQPDVAYISEVGDYPPQSCFFTLGCSLLGAAHIAAFVALATETQARLSVAVRSLPPSQAPLLARYVSSSTRMFWAGIIAGMGFMVTGSFQEVHVPTVHIIGALAVFVASIWYGCEAILHSRWRRKLGLDRGDVSAASAPSASSCQSCITTVLDNTLRSPGFIRAWRYVFQGVSIAGLLLLVGAIAIDRNTGSNDAAEPMERSIWAPIGEIVMAIGVAAMWLSLSHELSGVRFDLKVVSGPPLQSTLSPQTHPSGSIASNLAHPIPSSSSTSSLSPTVSAGSTTSSSSSRSSSSSSRSS